MRIDQIKGAFFNRKYKQFTIENYFSTGLFNRFELISDETAFINIWVFNDFIFSYDIKFL